MTDLSTKLLAKYYSNRVHPYQEFERRAFELLRAESTILDAGCGRTVPVLRKFIGHAQRLIGVELVDFTDVPDGVEVYKCDLANIPLPDRSVDLVMSRSVFEHLENPEAVYRELSRVLRPGGRIIFLTANMWDYGTFVARLIPNRFHAAIVRKVEGRAEEDTFPTAYKTNTSGAVERLAQNAGMRVLRFDYLNQYPNYLMFNGALFFIGMCYERLTSRFEALRWLRGWILVTLEKP